MRLQMLPSTIDESGGASPRQHLLSIIIDDRVAIDAGSLAFSCTDRQRSQIRDIVLSHTHLDHIAGLPMFIDDLFATLTEPICIHATRQMIETLERDVFNWSIYPRFSELSNHNTSVVEYREYERGGKFDVKHLKIQSVPVNHQVNASGFIISDNGGSVAISGDTAETDDFWTVCNSIRDLRAVLVECAFPNELADLASVSYHLTPARLKREIEKLENSGCPVFVINIKPMYRSQVVEQIAAARLPKVEILEVGKVYEW